MSTIPAGEIKRRGISAVDEALKQGPVQVIQRNEPRYVVLSVEQYRELREAYEEITRARLRQALEDVEQGRAQRLTAQEISDGLAALQGFAALRQRLPDVEPLDVVQLVREGRDGL